LLIVEVFNKFGQHSLVQGFPVRFIRKDHLNPLPKRNALVKRQDLVFHDLALSFAAEPWVRNPDFGS
jgi:hypothetical protein